MVWCGVRACVRTCVCVCGVHACVCVCVCTSATADLVAELYTCISVSCEFGIVHSSLSFECPSSEEFLRAEKGLLHRTRDCQVVCMCV